MGKVKLLPKEQLLQLCKQLVRTADILKTFENQRQLQKDLIATRIAQVSIKVFFDYY